MNGYFSNFSIIIGTITANKKKLCEQNFLSVSGVNLVGEVNIVEWFGKSIYF